MSIDLSSPEITQVCQELVDAAARTTWFYLHYHPSQDRVLTLSDRGADPLVQGWQNCIRSAEGQVGFGYGILGKNRPLKEGGERGVVLLYLPNSVTGVRRARSVVHSRAVANLFPNYSALITISSPDEITESFLQEHTNFHNNAVPTPSSSPVKTRPRPSDLASGNTGSGSIGLGRPQGQHTPVDRSASTASSRDKSLPPPPVEPLDIPQPIPTPPRTASPRMRESPSGSYAGSGTGSGTGQKGLGISSADVFGRTERKESLGSRLGRMIPTGAGGHGTSTGTAGGHGERNDSVHASPGSPSTDGRKKRFSLDTLTKSFGQGSPSSPREKSFSPGHGRVPSADVPPEDAELMRNVSDTSRRLASGRIDANGEPTPPGSPNTQSQAEKEGQRRRIPSLARLFPAPGSRSTSGSAKDGYSTTVPLPATTEVPVSDAADKGGPPLPPKDTHATGQYGIGPDTPYTDQPSHIAHDLYSSASGQVGPDGQTVLHQVSDNQVRAESQQHEEFRRNEEERTRIRLNSGNRGARVVGTPTVELERLDLGAPLPNREVEDDEEDLGLPYDREDHEPPVSARSSGRHVGVATPPRAEDEQEGDREPSIGRGAAMQSEATAGVIAAAGAAAGHAADLASNTAHATAASHNSASYPIDTGHSAVPLQEADESVTANILEDGEDDPSEPVHAMQPPPDVLHSDTDKSHLPEQSADAISSTTHELSLRQSEDLAQRRLSIDAQLELDKQAEEARVRIAEAEAAALAKAQLEQAMAEEEQREAEREARLRQEEYERELERKRIEDERVEEERKAREAEEVRHAAEEAFEGNLRAAKGTGEMLRGYVTVQTPKSMIWRRRWYALYSNEIKLYKAEGDASPIQTISLNGSRVSEKFDESQVHDSFKITNGPDDYFLFTDSPEDKATLLRALRVALE